MLMIALRLADQHCGQNPSISPELQLPLGQVQKGSDEDVLAIFTLTQHFITITIPSYYCSLLAAMLTGLLLEQSYSYVPVFQLQTRCFFYWIAIDFVNEVNEKAASVACICVSG